MGPQLFVNGISIGAVYALIAVGFAVVFSILRFSNFAHGGMISACAFIGYFFLRAFPERPPLVLILIFTAFCGMIIALLVDFLGYRRLRKNKSPNIYYFLMSLTFAILIEQILTVFYGTSTYGYPSFFSNETFRVGNLLLRSMSVVVLLVSLALLLALILLIHRTKIGLAIRAVAIDPATSRLMGINSGVITTAVFVIAGILAGITGVFLGAQYGVLPSIGPSMMIKGFFASVLGGLGSLGGAIAAAFALGLFEIIMTYLFGATESTVIIFGVMLVFLLLRPQGFSGRYAEEKV